MDKTKKGRREKKPKLGKARNTGKSRRCLVLLSGGLDSRLACKLMQEQLGAGNVEAVFFVLPFGGGCCSDKFCVFKFAQKEGIKLHIVDCTKGRLFDDYMSMIRKPKFSRGTALNPCMDCHAFMLKLAKSSAKSSGADFLVTGEVLGERPLSQNKNAMVLIEKEAGLSGKVLRPLSARLLPETEAEKKGWVSRGNMLGISGRRRVVQMELAAKYGIDYPSPGGGCLLTEKEYSNRLSRLLVGKANMEVIELAKLGRHFPHGSSVIIVGRNHDENVKLAALAKCMGYPTLEAEGFTGPTSLITSGNPEGKAMFVASMLTARYSDAPKGKKCVVLAKSGNVVTKLAVTAPNDTGFLGTDAQQQVFLAPATNISQYEKSQAEGQSSPRKAEGKAKTQARTKAKSKAKAPARASAKRKS